MSDPLLDYKSPETWTDYRGTTRPQYLISELTDMRVFSIHDTVNTITHNVTFNSLSGKFRCTCDNSNSCYHVMQVRKALGLL